MWINLDQQKKKREKKRRRFIKIDILFLPFNKNLSFVVVFLLSGDAFPNLRSMQNFHICRPVGHRTQIVPAFVSGSTRTTRGGWSLARRSVPMSCCCCSPGTKKITKLNSKFITFLLFFRFVYFRGEFYSPICEKEKL